MSNTTNLVYLALLNTVGIAIISQTLVEARNYIYGSNKRTDKEAFMFVKGTGLEIVMESYCLDYDTKKLRDTFFWNIDADNI